MIYDYDCRCDHGRWRIGINNHALKVNHYHNGIHIHIDYLILRNFRTDIHLLYWFLALVVVLVLRLLLLLLLGPVSVTSRRST